MKRPDQREMRTLPVLEERRRELETCVFCPKLCRSACPVSNAEPREALTPWGKMSLAYFVAHGDVGLEPSTTDTAWACTGCYACRERCDHRNEVGPTLLDARNAQRKKGHAPFGATRVLNTFDRHNRATEEAIRELNHHKSVRRDADTAVLVGCSYARAAIPEARDVVTAAAVLAGEEVCLSESCCGLPLLLAGDQDRFSAHAKQFRKSVEVKKRIVVHDAGCAMALRVHYPRAGVVLSQPVELLVEHAARAVTRLSHVPLKANETVRYHDPCQLGRGLGVYEAPRAVLGRILGEPPKEFDDNRQKGMCSGAGGLLPSTMPEVAKEITVQRLSDHVELGGGRIVTACASSLLAFRTRTELPIDDIATWIARSLEASRV